MPDKSTGSTERYCNICERYERCHCPKLKSWCSVCVPPAPRSFDPGAAWLRAQS